MDTIPRRTIVPCLFFSSAFNAEAIEIPIVLACRPKGQGPLHPLLERHLYGDEPAGVFFDVLAYALKAGVDAASEIQFCLDEKTASMCRHQNFLIDGNSFGFPLLVGLYLHALGLTWPAHCLASGQLCVARGQIVSVGAASQKLRYSFRQLPPEGRLFLPQSNVRRLRLAKRWRTAPLAVLPRRIEDGVALLLDMAQRDIK